MLLMFLSTAWNFSGVRNSRTVAGLPCPARSPCLACVRSAGRRAGPRRPGGCAAAAPLLLGLQSRPLALLEHVLGEGISLRLISLSFITVT